jgi:hypothetical protein
LSCLSSISFRYNKTAFSYRVRTFWHFCGFGEGWAACMSGFFFFLKQCGLAFQRKMSHLHFWGFCFFLKSCGFQRKLSPLQFLGSCFFFETIWLRFCEGRVPCNFWGIVSFLKRYGFTSVKAEPLAIFLGVLFLF